MVPEISQPETADSSRVTITPSLRIYIAHWTKQTVLVLNKLLESYNRTFELAFRYLCYVLTWSEMMIPQELHAISCQPLFIFASLCLQNSDIDNLSLELVIAEVPLKYQKHWGVSR